MTPGDLPPTEEPPNEELVSSKLNRGEKWVLTRDALDQLLEQFSPDPEEAAKKYVLMQTRLVRFFEWRGSPSPEDQAAETMDRVARKIQEGEEIFNLTGFFLEVARNVLREALRKLREIGMDVLPEIPAKPADEDEKKEIRLRCLDDCLDKLSPENRQLVLGYYADEKQEKIQHRRRLAEGSNLNALRIRVCRIRKELEKCVKDCVGKLDGAK